MREPVVYTVLLLCLIDPFSARVLLNTHNLNRTSILEEEERLSLGGTIQLTEDEQTANEILMRWKHEELDEYFNDPHFDFSHHFFLYKNHISKSKVYQAIKKMPKGAALHIHASMMLDVDSLIELTYEDHLYACYANGDLKLRFSDTVPSQPCPYKWDLLSDLRNASSDVAQFDAELRDHLTLYTQDEKLLNTDINLTWKRFNKIYATIKSIITYRPVRERYFYKALQNFYDDNVMYIEIRSGLHSLYELDGSTRDGMYLADLYQSVTRRFIKDHPDFIGVKLILTAGRWKSIDEVKNALLLAKKLKKESPEFLAGFDLIGQEDQGKPLSDFLPALVEVKGEIDFYFHGGETNWYGTSTDENLVDAILLGSKRIGHAYALVKHPTLLAAVNQRDIALEVNLISNIVLSLVRDVRNHPLATYLSLGLPVVLSSDDPGAWDTDPLSHDFCVAFLGSASRHADLRLLKQLALNSIKYSSLDDDRKQRLFDVFHKRWDTFIKDLIEMQ